MRLLAPCNTNGCLLVKIEQTQQMCAVIFLGLLNTTYLKAQRQIRDILQRVSSLEVKFTRKIFA